MPCIKHCGRPKRKEPGPRARFHELFHNPSKSLELRGSISQNTAALINDDHSWEAPGISMSATCIRLKQKGNLQMRNPSNQILIIVLFSVRFNSERAPVQECAIKNPSARARSSKYYGAATHYTCKIDISIRHRR